MDTDHVFSAGRILGQSRHICAFFNGLDEQYRVLHAFIKDGLDRGDRAIHLVDPERRNEHLRRLAEAAIDVQSALRSGQLEVQVWEESRLGGPRFDPDSWLASFQQALESGAAAGYAHTRFLGQMGWAHRDAADDEDWFEFESRLNVALAGHHDAVICAYDLATISAGVVIDALRTHPTVILGGLLQENPFFVAPDQFVAEIQRRRAERERVGVGR
jgi:hypothetical protein